MESEKIGIDNLIYKAEIETQMNKCMDIKGEGGWDELGDWVLHIYTIDTMYKIDNKALLYSTGNYIQYPVINHNGKEYEKECIYMYN